MIKKLTDLRDKFINLRKEQLKNGN